MIKLEHVNKSFGNKPVLKDINLEVNEGEIITVIGRSGCGKTSLLRLINGLLIPDCGTVYIKNENISEKDMINLRRSIGYVIQNKGLFPHMTVENNISYVPSISKKITKEDKKSIAKKMIELVGLNENMLLRYPYELSGGEQQRVGIARALAASPQIILMDEPFSSLDGITKKSMQDVILDLHKKLDLTIVFVTHDIAEAVKLGNRIVVMDQGEILQLGTPIEVKNNPNNHLVDELVN